MEVCGGGEGGFGGGWAGASNAVLRFLLLMSVGPPEGRLHGACPLLLLLIFFIFEEDEADGKRKGALPSVIKGLACGKGACGRWRRRLRVLNPPR